MGLGGDPALTDLRPEDPKTWRRDQLERGILYYQKKIRDLRIQYEKNTSKQGVKHIKVDHKAGTLERFRDLEAHFNLKIAVYCFFIGRNFVIFLFGISLFVYAGLSIVVLMLVEDMDLMTIAISPRIPAALNPYFVFTIAFFIMLLPLLDKKKII